MGSSAVAGLIRAADDMLEVTLPGQNSLRRQLAASDAGAEALAEVGARLVHTLGGLLEAHANCVATRNGTAQVLDAEDLSGVEDEEEEAGDNDDAEGDSDGGSVGRKRRRSEDVAGEEHQRPLMLQDVLPPSLSSGSAIPSVADYEKVAAWSRIQGVSRRARIDASRFWGEQEKGASVSTDSTASIGTSNKTVAGDDDQQASDCGGSGLGERLASLLDTEAAGDADVEPTGGGLSRILDRLHNSRSAREHRDVIALLLP